MRYQIAQRIVAISHFVEKSILESGVPPEKVTVVYEGVEVPSLPTPEARRKARQRWGMTGDEKLLGCIGYLLPEKGQEIAILALSALRTKVSGARLLLAGDGPGRPALEALVQQLGLRDEVIFAGFVEDVSQVYVALDAFVFPSLAEGFGLPILEAMARGVPVITSRPNPQRIASSGAATQGVSAATSGAEAKKPMNPPAARIAPAPAVGDGPTGAACAAG